ncbi:TIGR04086 family membrane protein [Bacillus chungangensis]|uniref:TIGR04086 family membrane protein n=1 Tax=Bacillus chungangensis TaxID=587633 RepID=UPI0027D918DD|nr:TIGR04086 family membrane protein [Bacillus chungangensis]
MLYGMVTIFGLIMISSFIFSFILRFSSVQEDAIHLFVMIAAFVIMFAGGFIAGGKGKQKGWFLGAATGVIYTAIIFLFQFLAHDSLFSLEQLLYHVCYILTIMMGAILGVNIHGHERG